MKKYVILLIILLVIGSGVVWWNKAAGDVLGLATVSEEKKLNEVIADESQSQEVKDEDSSLIDDSITDTAREVVNVESNSATDGMVNDQVSSASEENKEVTSSSSSKSDNQANDDLEVNVLEVDSSQVKESAIDVEVVGSEDNTLNSQVEVVASVSEDVSEIQEKDTSEYLTIEVDSSVFEVKESSKNTSSNNGGTSSVSSSSNGSASTSSSESVKISSSVVVENESTDEDVALESESSASNEQETAKEEDDLEEDKTVYSSEYVKLNKELKYLKYKNTYKLKATLNGIEGTVVWSSSNPLIAKVDQNGKVTATGGGLAIITATVGKEKVSCKVIAIRNTFTKLDGNPYRTSATVYYDGNKKITYYFRRQSYNTACSSEKVNGKEICTAGFRTWLAGHGCGTIATTAVVNAYLGNTKNELISAAKMRMYYEKEEYNWQCSSSDPYCNKSVFQLTRNRVADVLNNQFDLKAKAYVIKEKTGNEKHIERITNALAEGRPVIIFVNASQAGTTKFTTQNHTLVMVGFADESGKVLVLDSSHDGFKEDTVEEMVNQYIGRGSSNYRGYIVLTETKA